MSFAEDLEAGKVGEDVVSQMLESSAKIKSVINCTKATWCQEKDIDFLAEMQDGRVIRYEVKTDRQAHETGNLVYERTTSGHIGCLEKTEADYICYYLSENGRLYGFWTEDMRRYIERRHPRTFKMGDNATGYLLNIEWLLRERIIRRIK